MSFTPIDMQNTKMQMGRQDMEHRTREIANLQQGAGLDPAKDKKLREACQGFESIFIQKMWEQMRATVPQNSFMHGREEKFWQGMYDQELAKHMSQAGGIGLADMMYKQMTRSLVDASRSTASARGGAMGSGFVAQAAPLVPEAPAPQAAQPAAAAAPVSTPQPPARTGAHGPVDMYAGVAEQPQAPGLDTPAAPAASPAVPTGDAESPAAVQQALAQLQTQAGARSTMVAADQATQQARAMAAPRMSGRAVLPSLDPASAERARQRASQRASRKAQQAAQGPQASQPASFAAPAQAPAAPVQATPAAPATPVQAVAAAPAPGMSAAALHDAAAALFTQGSVQEAPGANASATPAALAPQPAQTPQATQQQGVVLPAGIPGMNPATRRQG